MSKGLDRAHGYIIFFLAAVYLYWFCCAFQLGMVLQPVAKDFVLIVRCI